MSWVQIPPEAVHFSQSKPSCQNCVGIVCDEVGFVFPQCINRMLGKGSPPTLSLVKKSSIMVDYPVEKYIPPNLARREKLKTKGIRCHNDGR